MSLTPSAAGAPSPVWERDVYLTTFSLFPHKSMLFTGLVLMLGRLLSANPSWLEWTQHNRSRVLQSIVAIVSVE